jgi:6-phosphogluconolactonase
MNTISLMGWALVAVVFCEVAAGGAETKKSAVFDKGEPALNSSSSQYQVYIGVYTGQKSKGIYSCRMNASDGVWTPPELAAEVKNPSFLALHPNGRILYAVSEIGGSNGKPGGAVSAFRREPTSGRLTLLNQQPSSGDGPCHLVVDKTGQCLIVANYGSGSVAALPIGSDGRLGTPTSFVQHYGSSVNPQRQKEPHAHCVTLDAANRVALVADLGMDKVLGYPLDAAKADLDLKPCVIAELKPGAGPRHAAFHSKGKYLYVINELDSTVTAFEYRSGRETLKAAQSLSTLPPDFQGKNYPAEIEVHPSGKFLYGSNRGHDSIALFQVNERTGKLTWVEAVSCQGKSPRHFKIDPSGRFLYAALQDSDAIVTFAIDRGTGRLTPTGQKIPVGAPVCVIFAPLL